MNEIIQTGIESDQLANGMRFAQLVAKSTLAPTAFRGKPEDILIAIMMGHEVGLKPMQSLQNIAVINGRPSLWGDAMLALVQAHPKFEYIKEEDDGVQATCIIKRKNADPHTVTFSMDDAQNAAGHGTMKLHLNRPGPNLVGPTGVNQNAAVDMREIRIPPLHAELEVVVQFPRTQIPRWLPRAD